MTGRRYRIFISSPSDVRPERAIAERVVAKLAREFAHHCAIEAVLWEREPLLASGHFQDETNIPAPSSTDICIVVLWSRLGVPLPPDAFRGALSGRPVTGTEWEFEDALRSYRELRLPDLLVYRKTAEIVASLSDEDALDELRRQKRLVTDFLERWFKSADGASFTAASHNFATTAEFEDRLEEHLRALLLRRLERDLDLHADAGAITWTEAPWPALASFELAQAPIFFGRTRARNELREMLAGQIAGGTAFVLVIGASGSGKSSLVKAGLLPDLMLPGMVGDVGLLRYGIMRPADGGGDTVRPLAETMLASTALPELAALEYTAAALAEQLRQNPNQAAFTVRQGLARAAEGKLTAQGEARLAIVIDQLEELFTLDAITAAERQVFVAVLEALARSGLVWIITTIRADFFDRLEQLPALGELSAGGRYLLLPPSLAEIGEIVRRPARSVGLRFEIDAATGEGLDEAIVHAAARDPGALPLLSFALDRLWRQPRDGLTLSYAAYAALGELEGAIAHHAESVVADLPEAALAILPGLLSNLVSLREGEQLATARPCRRAELERLPGADVLLGRLIEARLLIADDTAEGTSIRLAHEALLRSWPRLAAVIEDNREALAAMTRLRADLGTWERNNRRVDLLLPRGKRLSEGIELLAQRRAELGAAMTGFIEASAYFANAADKRRLRLVAVAFAILTMLMVAAAVGAGFGFSGQRSAIASRDAFQHQFEIAERARTQSLALALKAETDPSVVETVALDTLPRNRSPQATEITAPELFDQLIVAANANRQRIVMPQRAPISSGRFSPDGTRIVTASVDGDVQIWDAATGMLARTFHAHDDAIESAAFSTDGTKIVTASKDKTARVFNALSGAPLVTLSGHKQTVNEARFSLDGRHIVTGSEDQTARIWNAATGTLETELGTRSSPIQDVAFSPDGRHIVVASMDKTASLWDAASGKQIAHLAGHTGPVFAAAFSPDGRLVVTASDDRTARIWDAATGAPLRVLSGHHGVVFTACFSPDSRRVLTASNDQTARIWDAASGLPLITLTGHDAAVRDADFSPDGRYVATVSDDRTARIWDVVNGAPLAVLAGHRDIINTANFSPDGARIVTGSDDETARIWDAATGALITTLAGHEASVSEASFSPDGRRVVTGSADKTARIWEVDGGRSAIVLAGHQDAVGSAEFSPDGQRIITGSYDGTARIWNAGSGALIATLAGHKAPVTIATFSPDGRRVLTASDDWTAREWDGITGVPLTVLSGHKGTIDQALFDPEGKRIATGSADMTARIWDAGTGAPLAILPGHGAAVGAVAYSLDGRRIVTGSDDKTTRLWDSSTGALQLVLTAAEAPIDDARFAPTGHYILTASADGSARVWDEQSGDLLAIMTRPQGSPTSVSYSRDGHRILTIYSDRVALVWDAPTYFSRADLAFIRATASHDVDPSLRARYALPPAAGPTATASPSACVTATTSLDQTTVANLTSQALSSDGSCHQRLAEHYESINGTAHDPAKAFFHHAVAARLLEAEGSASAAQVERYRREALAWCLPRQRIVQLMDEAEAWKPEDPMQP